MTLLQVLGCLISCLLQHVILPLVLSLLLITIQRQRNKHVRGARRRKGKGQRRCQKGLYFANVAQVSVVVICRFEIGTSRNTLLKLILQITICDPSSLAASCSAILCIYLSTTILSIIQSDIDQKLSDRYKSAVELFVIDKT